MIKHAIQINVFEFDTEASNANHFKHFFRLIDQIEKKNKLP